MPCRFCSFFRILSGAAVRTTSVPVLCAALAVALLATQAVWWWLGTSTLSDAHNRQSLYLQQSAALTAHRVYQWLQDRTDMAGSVVLEPDPAAQAGWRVRTQHGLPLPPELWMTANTKGPVLAPPVLLDNTPCLLLAFPLPDGSRELRVKPLHTLLALLANTKPEAELHTALHLSTPGGTALLYAALPPARLREALEAKGRPATVEASDMADMALCALPPETGTNSPAEDSSGTVRAISDWGTVGVMSTTHSTSGTATLFFGLPGLSLLLSLGLLLTLGLLAGLYRLWRRQNAVHPAPEQHQQGRQLSEQLLRLLEGVRHSLARELHDHLGQRLTTLMLRLEASRQRADAHKRTEPGQLPLDPALQELPLILQELALIQQELRRLAWGLRPPALEMLGLVAALQSLCDSLAGQGADMRFFHDQVPALDYDRALALYRVAQEALNNVQKYAQARQVFVSLVTRDGVLALSVEDDGCGFEVQGNTRGDAHGQTDAHGWGLILMRERLAPWGGSVVVHSQPGQGTQILAELPL